MLQYDRANIKWTEAMALGNARSSTDDGGPVPMEIDRVKGGKGKDKGKKGKVKGKEFKVKGKYAKNDGGKSKGKDKGKSKDYGKHGKGAGVGRGLYLQMFASYAVEKDIGAVNVQSGH